MKVKLSILLVLLLLVVGVIGCETEEPVEEPVDEPEEEPVEEPAEEEETLKVAAVGALSGPIADWGIPIREAVFYWAEDVNERGGIEVDGTTYMIEPLAYDDEGDTEEMLEIFNRLIYDEGVDYILPLFIGSSAYAALDIVDENEVLIMSAAYGYDDVLGEEHPTWFRNFTNPQERNPVLMEWVNDKYPEVERWMDIVTDCPAGMAKKEIHQEVGPELGFEVLEAEILEPGTTDFTPIMSRVLEKDPDVINLGNVDWGTQPAMVQTARDLGYEGLIGTCSNGLLPDVFVPAAGGPEYAEGFYSNSLNLCEPYGVARDHVTDTYINYYERYMEDHGHFSDWSGDNYVSLQVIEEAMIRADSVDPMDVAMEIEGGEFETMIGTVNFGGEARYGRAGQMLPPLPFSIIDDEGGKETVDMIPIEDE